MLSSSPMSIFFDLFSKKDISTSPEKPSDFRIYIFQRLFANSFITASLFHHFLSEKEYM